MLLHSPPPLPDHPPKGVFITGTDTGIGKTLTSAILTRAWQGTYWKPYQTGLAEEEGDTPTVRRLTGLPDSHFLPPACALRAPLAPAEAAALEGVQLRPGALTLPEAPHAPLVVEGAGGLMVPITGDMMMIDLIARLGLPVILVARSGLGTINHTLLSLEALYRRGIAVSGFITSGPEAPAAIQTIQRASQCRALHHISVLSHPPGADDIRRIAAGIPPWTALWQG